LHVRFFSSTPISFLSLKFLKYDIAPAPNAKYIEYMSASQSTMPKQLSLKDSLPLGSNERSQLNQQLYPRTRHGGQLSVGRRKTPRPFSPKAPTHLVLRSKRAKGLWSMQHRQHRSKITSMIYVYAARFKVHVYRATNVGDQLHLLVKSDERKNLADFLRVLAGRIAVTVSGARRGVKRIGKFWDYLCWSRLVNWGKDFFQVRRGFAESEKGDEKTVQIFLQQSELPEFDTG
jgi:hypothetical protein